MEDSCSQKRADASRTWQVGNTRGVPVPGCVSTIPAPPRKHSVPDDVSQEIRLLLGTLKPESVVFEWGSGMSSLYYSQCVTNWTSVEHHLPWCHEMQKHAPTAQRACKVCAHRRGVCGLVWLARHVGRLQAGIQGLLGTCLRSKGAAARLRSKAT